MKRGLRTAAEFFALAALLFVTRFLLRGHLVPQMDQECHVGGVAVDFLAHGVRFPLSAYAPNEYDNGSFFSGLLVAGMFALVGVRLLALKLVTHLVVSAGALAALSLLRRALSELHLDGRARRAALFIFVCAFALSPRIVTGFSTYGVGNHAEGTAIDMLLVALYVRIAEAATPWRRGLYWALVGFGLYLNKGTVLVVAACGILEVAAPSRWTRLRAAIPGFLVGALPELYVLWQRHGLGWGVMSGKLERNSGHFPHAFLISLVTFVDGNPLLGLLFLASLVMGIVLLVRSWRARAEERPLALAAVVAFLVLHLMALTVMAKEGMDAYVTYAFPPFAVLLALVVALAVAQAQRSRVRAALALLLVAALPLTLALQPWHWSGARVQRLWNNRAGAACSWRLAEGFMREYQHHLATSGDSQEAHVIARCRSLSDETQRADCIGGIARELNWRRQGNIENGAPPPALSPLEQRAYAFQFGTHRRGDTGPCAQFTSDALKADCVAAVELDCLVFTDLYTRLATGKFLRRPACVLHESPLPGYWSEMRDDFLSRADKDGTNVASPDVGRAQGDDDLRLCRPFLARCYPTSDFPK